MVMNGRMWSSINKRHFCPQWRNTAADWLNMKLEMLNRRYWRSPKIVSSEGWFWWLMMNQQVKQMMDRKLVGSWMVNSHSRKRVLVGGCIKVMSSARHLDGWRRPVRPWNIEKIMRVIGMASFFANRWSQILCSKAGTDLPQLNEKIIPTFEKFHGPGYQALFLIDNSQGHSAYAEDALLVSKMNLNPGKKHPEPIRDGWYYQNGQKVVQSMFSDAQHKQPKGIKLVLTERGLWPKKGLHLECKPKCASGSRPADCCARNLLNIETPIPLYSL